MIYLKAFPQCHGDIYFNSDVYGVPENLKRANALEDKPGPVMRRPCHLVTNMVSRQRHIVLFGTFDGVHDGHRDLFRQARGYGGRLTAIIARDLIVLRLKNQVPKFSERIRFDLVMREELVDDAVLGDSELSVYQFLRELGPDVICLGYDQQKLGADLQLWMNQTGESFPIYYLKPCKPHLLHNSIMQSNRS